MSSLNCIICYEAIEPRDLVVCTNCHSAYHRDCLKLAYADRSSHLYHCCSYCTLKMSMITLIRMNEISINEMFNRLLKEKAGALIVAIRDVYSIFEEISSSFVAHEQTYAMLCWYMTKKRFEEPDKYRGLECIVEISSISDSYDKMLAVVDAMRSGLYFIHSNLSISEFQWPSLRTELEEFESLKISDEEFFDIYDLVSTNQSKRTFNNLSIPRIEAMTLLSSMFEHPEHPRYKRLQSIMKSMILTRAHPKPKHIMYIAEAVQLCARLNCDGLVFSQPDESNPRIQHLECNRCGGCHCKQCGRLEHEGLCDADDMVEYSNRLEHQHICYNCRSYIKLTPKNTKTRWYCPICREAFIIKDLKLFKTDATFDQLIESVTYNNIGPIIDNIFDYIPRTRSQLLSYLMKTNAEPASNILYQFAQILIQEGTKNREEELLDILMGQASNIRAGGKIYWPEAKMNDFIVKEFVYIVRDDIISMLKTIACEHSFDKALIIMSSIVDTYKAIARNGDMYFKQFRALIKPTDEKMKKWVAENLD